MYYIAVSVLSELTVFHSFNWEQSRVAWLNQARLGKLHLLETTAALLTLGNTKHIRSVPWWIVRRPSGPSEIFPIPRRIKILFHLPPKSARCKEHIKQTEIYGLYLHLKVLNSGGHLQSLHWRLTDKLIPVRVRDLSEINRGGGGGVNFKFGFGN